MQYSTKKPQLFSCCHLSYSMFYLVLFFSTLSFVFASPVLSMPHFSNSPSFLVLSSVFFAHYVDAFCWLFLGLVTADLVGIPAVLEKEDLLLGCQSVWFPTAAARTVGSSVCTSKCRIRRRRVSSYTVRH